MPKSGPKYINEVLEATFCSLTIQTYHTFRSSSLHVNSSLFGIHYINLYLYIYPGFINPGYKSHPIVQVCT